MSVAERAANRGPVLIAPVHHPVPSSACSSYTVLYVVIAWPPFHLAADHLESALFTADSKPWLCYLSVLLVSVLCRFDTSFLQPLNHVILRVIGSTIWPSLIIPVHVSQRKFLYCSSRNHIYLHIYLILIQVSNRVPAHSLPAVGSSEYLLVSAVFILSTHSKSIEISLNIYSYFC